ncbi:MAG: hypothetical protein DCC71_07695 [Proteobacteria bacterium]|nr:MAG: hypothetical protein DCC71_07695 [Pseudomonadota bacterium]
MWKYYALLFTAVALVLAYTYVADPGDVLLDSGAEMGSAESVRCRISYRDPGGTTHEAVWLYHHHDTAWEFGRVVESDEKGSQR